MINAKNNNVINFTSLMSVQTLFHHIFCTYNTPNVQQNAFKG